MTCSRRSTRWCASAAFVALGAAVTAAPAASTAAAPAADRESEIRQAIVQSVKNRMGGEVTVRIDAIRLGAAAGDGEGSLAATPEPGARLARAIRFSLSRRPSGGLRNVPSGYAVATVFVDAPHARAARPIGRGETCGREDVVAARSELGPVLLQRLPSVDEIVGTRALRDVMADEIITRSLVAVRAAVTSGDVVTLEADIEGVRARTEAVAAQSGDAGDTIRVVNRESRRAVKARVVAPGKVEVVQ